MIWGAPLLLLLLGVLWLQPARAGSHSLRYFASSLSGPLPGVPQFSEVGYLDDVPITSYTSESRRHQPRAPWMERITTEDPQYWEEETERNRGWEQGYKANVRTAMERLNHTGGLHIIQYMYGCELRADGSVGGFSQDAFDGHDFLSLDKDRLTWTAAMDAARITQDRWNSERVIAERFKDYLEGRCIEYLQKYLKLGEEKLKAVAPQTMVTRRKNGDRTFLSGYAYGFYPREIEVKWVRNGVEIPWESSEILPNPDGNYQAKKTVEVQEGDDEKTYRYEVYHSSLPDTVTVMYEEKSPPMGVIIGGVIGALVGVALLAAVVWVVYSRKKTSGKPTYAAAKQETALHSLDVQRCLKFYIDRTKDFRKTPQLFVAFSAPRKGLAISKQGVARWVSSAIQFCHMRAGKPLHSGVHAHSTRAMASSAALFAGVQLSDICRAATWSTTHTFTKHYCLDASSQADAAVGQAVLRNLFH